MTELYGRRWVEEADAFELNDVRTRQIQYYAPTERVCRKWIRKANNVAECIEVLLEYDRQVVSIVGPEKIGNWRPSRFRHRRQGYRAFLTYRRLRPRQIKFTELDATACIEGTTPAHIYGVIDGRPFHFHDASYRLSATRRSRLYFRWEFNVENRPTRRPIPDSRLPNDASEVRHEICPITVFALRETETMSRKNPLSHAEAQRIVVECVREYVQTLRSEEAQ